MTCIKSSASEKRNSHGLKKNCTLTLEERRRLIVEDDPAMSLSRQASLLDVSRASLYYRPLTNVQDDQAKGIIDRLYTDYPFYGSRRMKVELEQTHDICIGRDHVRRLMQEMGIEAIYPKKKRGLSAGDPRHQKYPYLLRGIVIERPDQVWGSDITYIQLERGCAYLVASIDWFSRYIVAWRLSPFLDTTFCIEMLKEALRNARPEIWNTDQGVQFTSRELTTLVAAHDAQISMDGRGRCMDNIFTERFWRTLKYENIYLHSYASIDEARAGILAYITYYNNQRKHSSLNYATPSMIYRQA